MAKKRTRGKATKAASAKRTSKRTRRRIIDAHQHVFWHGRDDAKVVANMDANGIDVAWLLTWEISPTRQPDTVQRNARALDPRTGDLPLDAVAEAVRRHPARFVPFFAPDPKEPCALERLQAAVEVFGVRGCGEWKDIIRSAL